MTVIIDVQQKERKVKAEKKKINKTLTYKKCIRKKKILTL